MIDPLSEFIITAVVIGVLAWCVSWLVQMVLPEIYLPACVVVGVVAVVVILYQLIGLARGVPDRPDLQDNPPAAHAERRHA